jgi:hypothetical protein
MRRPVEAIWWRAATLGCAVLLAACGSSSSGTSGSGGTSGGSGGTTGSGGATSATGGSTGGGTGGSASGGVNGTGGTGTLTGTGGAPGTGGQAQAGTGGTGAGQAGAGGGGGHATGAGGQAGGATGGAGGAVASACTGKAWPTADPTTMGPFAVTSDKNVGPLAGAVPDPVYGNTQQRFNVYRPSNLDDGYCHPILVWANGHGDNPEPNPPQCVTGGGQYCGSYLMLMQQMASHGFVVIASLSTITSQGNPLPTIVGLDWLLQQADDPTSPYYHHLDTAHIGAFGHSEGGLSTFKAASDPRISAIATVSGATTNAGIHEPALLFCGGKDTVVPCSNVTSVYSSITDQPAMLIDNLASDHGGWLYQNGAKGPDIFGMTAWFRVQLMNDTANRKYFYGPTCTFCSDSRVTLMRNSFLTQ